MLDNEYLFAILLNDTREGNSDTETIKLEAVSSENIELLSNEVGKIIFKEINLDFTFKNN